MKKITWIICLVSIVAIAKADDIIVSWSSNGVLCASGMAPGSTCTVEWASNLQDGFITNDAPFAGLVADSNGTVQVSIPMFFRVRAVQPSMPVTNQVWHTDFEAAKGRALAEDKPILMNFTGSDWSSWCIKLETEVFATDTFNAYAEETFVLMLVDFPVDESEQTPEEIAQNEALGEDFQIVGYPTVVLLNPDEIEIARTGYRPGGASAYIEHLDSLLEGAE